VRKMAPKICVLLVCVLTLNLLFPAVYGRQASVSAQQSGADDAWTKQETVSLSASGETGNGQVMAIDIAPDGRYVAFQSFASNMDPRLEGSMGMSTHIYVHDRLTGKTELIDANSAGAVANSYSESPSISDDGRMVVFESAATNLLLGAAYEDIAVLDPDSYENFKRVYAFDREIGEMTLVSVNAVGDPADYYSQNAEVSGDGSVVVFESEAGNLAGHDNEYKYNWQIYARNLNAGTTVMISDPDAGTAYQPSVDDDGTSIAYVVSSYSDGGYATDVYRFDAVGGAGAGVSTPTRTRITGDTERTEDSTLLHERPSISGDGTKIVFTSASPNLTVGDSNGFTDIFLYDDNSGQGTLSLVSVNEDGIQGNGASHSPDLSPDGRYIGFVSDADNLRPGIHFEFVNNLNVIYWLDTVTGKITNLGGLALAKFGLSPSLSNQGFAYYDYYSARVALNPADLPVWPSGKSLTKQVQQDGSIALNWTPIGLPNTLGYKIYEKGPHPTIGSSYKIERLIARTTDTHYTVTTPRAAPSELSYRVEAVSSQYAASDSGPKSDDVATPDTTPPSWPSGATIEPRAVSADSVTLAWPAAVDNVGVSGYRIYRGVPGAPESPFALAAETPGTSLKLESLNPETGYAFYVVAYDAKGNTSAALPVITVTTLSTTAPEGGELTAQPLPNGDIKLTWSAGAAAARYEVWNVSDTSAPVKIADKTAAELQFTVGGLSPSTTYKFKVYGFSGEETVYETMSVTAQTAAMSISGVSISRNGIFGSIASIGATETISVRGQPGRTANVQVVYTTWNPASGTELLETPREVTETVTMQENASIPGLYTGTFTFAEGIEKLVRVEARLTAGGTQTTPAVQLAGLPIFNAAMLTVNATSNDSLQHYKISVFSPSSFLSQFKTITTNGQSAAITFDRLSAADDIRIRVLNAAGRLIADKPAATLKSGQAMETDVQVISSKKLKLRVMSGSTPVRDQMLSLTGEYGAYTLVTTDEEGYTPLTVWDAANSKVNALFYRLPSRYMPPASTEIALESTSVTEREIVLASRPMGTIRGTVLNADGSPYRNATVMLEQELGDEAVSNSAVVGADGKYAFEAFAGPAKITFRGDSSQYDSIETAVPNGGEVVENYRFDPSALRILKVNLFTRYGNGSWQGPLPIDWTTGIHLRIMVDGQLVTTDAIPLMKKPGSKVTVSADGIEGNLGKASVEAILEEDGVTEVELRLSQTSSKLTAVLQSPAAWSGYWLPSWTGELLKRQPSGEWDVVRNLNGYNINVREDLPGDGHYRLVINSPHGRAVKEFDAAANVDVDLGTLALALPTGVFEGRDGNGLTAFPSELAPGQIAKLRLTYNASAAAVNAKFLLDVPTGVALMPGTVVMDGREAAYTIEDGKIAIAAGNLPAGANGTLLFQLKLLEESASSLPISGRIVYGAAGAQQTETVGTLKLTNEPLTLTAPRNPSGLDWALGGRAPADSKVFVFASGKLVGQAIASAGGYWKLDAKLPDPQGARTYAVHAETEWNGKQLRSAEARVDYDPEQPAIEQLTIQQEDGRRISLDVSKGPAKFPYVVVPGRLFFFEVKFNNPDRVRNVKVHIRSSEGDLSGEAELRDGIYYAELPSNFGMTESVYVTYDRKPAGLPEIDSEQAFKAQLPPAMRDYAVADQQQFSAVDANTVRGSMDMTLPQARELGFHIDLELQRNTGYTPTAEALALAEQLGVEAYDVQYNVERDGDEIRTTITAYVPEDKIEGMPQLFGTLTNPANRKLAGREVGVASLGNAGQNFLKVTANVLWNEKSVAGQVGKGAGSIYDTKSAVDGRGQVADNMEELGNLAGKVAACNPAMAGYYGQRIERMATQALAVEAAKWGLMIAGAVLAPATMGGSLALMGVSMGIGMALDAGVGHQMDLLKDSVNNSVSGKCPDNDEGGVTEINLGNPTATPVWIYDPSGYVYETFEDNRIAGVKATVYYRDAAAAAYAPWDAEWYGQTNPQVTDGLGKYGWDVPPGRWQVVYEKDGYETARSAELDVPPPHFDVNIPLVSYLPPQITAVKAETSADGGTVLTIETDKYIAANRIASDGIRVSLNGELLEGEAVAVSPRPDGNNNALTRTIRFSSSQATAIGAVLNLTIKSGIVVSYAGTAMEADYTAEVAAKAKDTAPPALESAIAAVGGSIIELRFSEALDTARPLARSDFALTGTPLTVQGAEYGPDGRSVKLTLGGKLHAAVQARVTIAGNKLFDPSGNAYAGGTASVDNRVKAANAALSSLSVAGYALSPSFQSGQTSYQAIVPDGVNSLTLTAVAGDPAALIRMNGRSAASGAATVVPIVDEAVIIVVTAADGTTKRYYEVAIVRGSVAPPQQPGGGIPAQPANVSTNGKLDVPKGQAGTVSLGEEVTVDIPQGASEEAIRITIEKLGAAPAASGLLKRLSDVFEIVKSVGGNFKRPVTITFKLGKQPEAGQAAAIYYYDEKTREWVKIASSVSGNTISATVDHFTKFAVFSAAEPAAFSDIAGHWGAAAIAKAVERGITNGYTDGTFRPNARVTRAEFAAMLARALKLNGAAGELAFADAAGIAAWAKPGIAGAVEAGLIKGYADGTFRPGQLITRTEMAVIAARVLQAEVPQSPVRTTFADDEAIPAWARISVFQVQQAGVMKGGAGNRFNPSGQATRAEAVAILVALAERLDK